ncbi:MAG TPA: IS200/IS605 family transposase [Terriglobia bacterium]|nr:IS200/IS605 family transposase [Terriglobia bacterium]
MAHTYTNLLIHALFSTKDRRPVLDEEIRHELFAYMGGIIKAMHGKPVVINGPSDHVHLLFTLPATVPLADLMETLKSNSSKWVRDRWPRRGFAWQTGYTGFSVSQSRLEDVKAYIVNQEAHHKKLTYQEEVLSLLKHHRIEFDPRYVF